MSTPESTYTPTTDEMREAFQYTGDGLDFKKAAIIRGETFDRWLAAHDAEVARKALTDAADAWLHGQWADAPRMPDRVQERIANGQHVGDWLRKRAEQIGEK